MRIGNYCKLNAAVYICTGVTISDYVMLAAHTVFTNDRFPRAFDRTLDGLASSDPNEETLSTTVGVGVTMGSVVTRNVPAHGLVIGNPARLAGYVCACGPVLVKLPGWEKDSIGSKYECERCGRVFEKTGAGVKEVGGVKKREHRG